MNGSIRAGAFRNMNLSGRIDIFGIIDTLEEYALAGMSISGISMPAIIFHMGNGVYKDTHLGNHVIPLSNSLKTIGSRVFEGTNLKGIQLPEYDTVEYAASDAFEEGMLIIIPEGLSNLDVFHFDQYQNLTFQTAEGLSDNSPVIQYLDKNRLVYKKGENGKLIYPEYIAEPTETPKPTVTPYLTPEPAVAQSPAPSEIQPEKADSLNKTNKNNTYKSGRLKYHLLGKNKASVAGAANKNITSVSIPGTVTIKGKLYQMDKIEKRALPSGMYCSGGAYPDFNITVCCPPVISSWLAAPKSIKCMWLSVPRTRF